MCHDSPASDLKEAGALESKDEIEVTPEMIEAGVYALYGYDITDPSEEEMRIAVTDIFCSMERIRRLGRGS